MKNYQPQPCASVHKHTVSITQLETLTKVKPQLDIPTLT